MARTTFTIDVRVGHDDCVDGVLQAEDLIVRALSEAQQEYPDILDFQCERVRTE